MPWHNLKNPQVRDLAWAGFSPTLLLSDEVRGAGLRWTPAWEDRLTRLDRNPEPLLQFLGDTLSGRLGIYYERLWHYLLAEDEDVEPVAHNLPVRVKGQTLGEFDCIYYCRRRRQHVHLELAVKLYLGVPGEGYWLGPGGKDRLDLKLGHLLQKQIQLGTQAAAQKVLADYGVDDFTTAIDFKGYLFNASEGLPLPEAYNSAVAMQSWYSLENFLALPPLAGDWLGWRELPRRHWLAPHRHRDTPGTDEGVCSDSIQRHFERTGRPLLIAACDADGEERQRSFITPPGWPGTGGAHQV